MRRCIKIGGIGGAASGLIVFLGYVLASWWVCSGLLDCPGHWLPYLIIFAIGVSVFTLSGLILAAILHWFYQFTKVDDS